MDAFLGDWANLLLRWAHLVAGIGWIGTSFYFIALDDTLRRRERMNEGVLGTSWLVHGGGFYHVEKYTVAPAALPAELHWFRWEAYLTWVTGFALLVVQYYVNARSYLIDPSVPALDPWQAIAISAASLVAGWLIYDLLCRSPIGARTPLLAASVFLLVVLAALLYGRVFSGRGAFVHVGALVGTIMAVNVFAIIIPNQKKMIAQMLRGETPDARLGRIGKQRSLHNNYLTLPVLVMMVSPHYPFLSSHPQSFLVVALILVGGAMVRHALNRFEAGDDWNRYGWALPVAALALIAAIYLTVPRERMGGVALSAPEGLALVKTHCANCHARRPGNTTYAVAPGNVTLETMDDIRQHAATMLVQIEARAMPLGNETALGEEDRARLVRWIGGLK